MIHRTLMVAGALALAGPALAQVNYNEATAGELSANRLAPTNLGSFGLGLNTLTGTFGRFGTTSDFDIDYATFTVPAGMQLDRLRVLTADVGGAVSFLGIEAGSQISVPYDTVDSSTLLGWSHFESANQGQDILAAVGAGPGAIGFQGALGPGTYTLWIMELSTERSFDYAFEFRLVPAPGPAATVLAGAALVSRRRRR
jgi:hypothetical protein